MAEQLIGTYRQMLQGLAPTGAAGGGVVGCGPAAREGRGRVGRDRSRRRSDLEEVTAYRGDNHELLIQQFFKPDRATIARPLHEAGIRGDVRRPQRPGRPGPRDQLLGQDPGLHPDHVDGAPLTCRSLWVNRRRAIRDRKHPGMLVNAISRRCVHLSGRGVAHRRHRGGRWRRVRRLEPAPAHLRRLLPLRSPLLSGSPVVARCRPAVCHWCAASGERRDRLVKCWRRTA